MTFALKSIIVGALAVTALAAPLPSGSHSSRDPCTTLSTLNDGEITYAHVKACYEHIPYNTENNAQILQSLSYFYDQFWAYKGAALTPNLGAPFDYKPVDIFAEFASIAAAKHTSDYAFHEAMRLSINKLQDAHSTYVVNCYKSYIFAQPLTLYAPVVDGVQSIRVLYDDTNNNLEECQVDTINGQDALTYIHEWADVETGTAKDPSVRLNVALGGMIYTQNGQFGPSYGSFARRTNLPESPAINYTLTCQTPQGTRSLQARVSWAVARTTLWKPFRDTASFYQNCLASAVPEETQGDISIQSLDSERREELALMHRQLPHKFEQYLRQVSAAPTEPEERRPPLQNAILVATTAHTAMYQLRSHPNVGVVVVPTMVIEDKEYRSILRGLTALARRNVTNIILDLSNNGGGYVDFAGALISWFFPDATNAELSNPGDFRITTELQRISELLLSHKVSNSLYSPDAFVNPQTLRPFTTNFFLEPVEITRGGLTDTYTHKLMDRVTPLDNIPRFPWSNNPDRIKILTDGQCGSSCTLSASVMIQTYGVESYTVGGYQGKPISVYSFAGGTIQNWQDVYGIFYNKLGLASQVPDFSGPPLNGTYNVATYEVYVGSDPLPLDYTPERFPSKYQIDYSSEIVRHPDTLWTAVGDHAWPAEA
ncbi:hypothetical protein BGW41_007636 [Actinomortierella wolfii]|nr:hypothetical protein BGW41_007636 [Actinomortierella wolfii]